MSKSGVILTIIAIFTLPILIFLIISTAASVNSQKGLIPILIVPIIAIVLGAIFICIADYKKNKNQKNKNQKKKK